MQEEILLDMYRSSWDDFLDSYKEKIDQNEELIKLIGEIFDSNKAIRTKFSKNLGAILEPEHVR